MMVDLAWRRVAGNLKNVVSDGMGIKTPKFKRLSISVDTHLMFVLQLVAGVMIDAHLGVFQHFLATDFQQLPVDHGGTSCWSSLLSNTHLYSYLAHKPTIYQSPHFR